jgi:hypothetical protein
VIETAAGSGPTMSPTPVVATGRPAGQTWHFAEPESGVIEPFADYELIFRPSVKARERGKKPGDGDAGSDGARLPTPGSLDALLQSAGDKSGPVIWLTVQKNEYEQLKRDLRTRGAIEQEREFPLFRNDGSSDDIGRYQIKVTVLPPN